MKTQDLVVGKLYKDKMFPEQTFVYLGLSTLLTYFEFESVEFGEVAGLLFMEGRVNSDITPAEVN